MAIETLGAALRHINRLFVEGTVSGLPDAQLLDRFLAGRDREAFEVLVARHGPMVLSVCRGILRNPSDAEDAFQATFLVLVKKAAHAPGPRQPGRAGCTWSRYRVADPGQRRRGPAASAGEEGGRDGCHDLIARSRHPG